MMPHDNKCKKFEKNTHVIRTMIIPISSGKVQIIYEIRNLNDNFIKFKFISITERNLNSI